MQRINGTTGICTLLTVLCVFGVTHGGDQTGTTITFQGQLRDGSAHVSDTCDLTFSLWNSEESGVQIGSDIALTGVAVVDGLFHVKLDFDEAAFLGLLRWIQTAAKCTGDADFVVVSPRQKVGAVPQARLTGLATRQTPRGVIAMWSGQTSQIPAGWALCNGSNGTPDLRDRFVVGAGSGENPGALGGAPNHSHQVASHVHAVDPPSGMTATAGAHTHALLPHSHSIDFPSTNTGATANHTHTLDVPATASTNGSNHGHTVDPGAATTTTAGAHSHGGATGQTCGSIGRALVKQDDDIVQCHTHSIGSAGSHSHTVDPAATASSPPTVHTHSLDLPSVTTAAAGSHAHSLDLEPMQSSVAGGGATSFKGDHSHAFDLNPVQTSSSPETETSNGGNRPKHYEMAFIMKL